jgi:Raf kinase inhibitor-like YbhB/YbcL family protein
MHTIKSFESTRVEDYKPLKIHSGAFEDNKMIPSKFTCDGENVNPSIRVSHIPDETVSLAIIVDDPDAPHGIFTHWVVWNIPMTHEIKEKEKRGKTGKNDFGVNEYKGPCPPSGVHRYNFKVYALDSNLDLQADTEKDGLEKAMCDHILGFGSITGKYGRSHKNG